MKPVEDRSPEREPAFDAHRLLEEAVAFHQRGEFTRAEAAYLQILAVPPDQPHARRLLGVLRHQQGRHAEALDLIDGAIDRSPRDAEAHANRGNVLLALQRGADAVASYDQALALRPDDPDTLYNRGNALMTLGCLAEAVASFERAIELQPDHAPAFCNRGNALLALERANEALASFDAALSLAGDDAATLYNRGNALMRLGRHEAALVSYDRALTVSPDLAEAYSNRGNALLELKRPAEALASFDAALALQPDRSEALSNRGNALLAVRRLEDALASYQRALALAPDQAELHANLGNPLLELGRAEEALAHYDRALALQPSSALTLVYRGSALRELQRLGDALVSYETALRLDPRHKEAFGAAADCAMKLCDWRWLAGHEEALRRHVSEGTAIVAPFLMLVQFDDPALHLQCARNLIGDRVAASSRPPGHARTWRNPRIKVAYLSADFRRHATAYLIAELIERHDRARFEVIGLSFGPDDRSDMRARLASAFDRFIDVTRRSDEEVAELVRSSRIDIAVDLMGHTQQSRPAILASRPAPVQVAYLGFPGSTGADFIDYIIADPIVLPFDRQRHFTEKIVHLPDCYQVNDGSRRIAASAPTREGQGLPDEEFIFCCFNTSWKITPPVFEVWMRLLAAVPGSVLWLLHDNPGASWNLRLMAAAHGIDEARLIFAQRTAPEEHLARHGLADLFLDTLPYNAHTTASDALWAGLPLLTCQGETFAARVAASLLNAVGLPELVTSSLADYEALALSLANDKSSLRRLRERLAINRPTCPLFDSERFRRHMEAAYLTMWELWQKGLPPRSFSVEPIDFATR